jgi:hypothetical protein
MSPVPWYDMIDRLTRVSAILTLVSISNQYSEMPYLTDLMFHGSSISTAKFSNSFQPLVASQPTALRVAFQLG